MSGRVYSTYCAMNTLHGGEQAAYCESDCPSCVFVSAPDSEVDIRSIAHCKVVGSSQDVNAMRESPLPPHVLLEGCLGEEAGVKVS